MVNFLPIVDGGYSLQYSPLMVHREGSGVMVLCQLDVTGRTEDDPAAARLVANIINYVSAYSPPPSRTASYVGEEAGRVHLAATGLALAPYEGGPLDADRVLVVGPGGGEALAPDADAVRQWLEAGGRLFAIGLGGTETGAFLPAAVTTTKAEHICTGFEPAAPDSPLAGIAAADVHSREPRDIELVSGGATVIGNGVLATAADGSVVLSQMPPWHFDYKERYNLKRTFRRTSFLVTRVLGNLGCSAPTPLIERFATPVAGDEADPRWLNGYYLDEPEEFDDPYRSFGW